MQRADKTIAILGSTGSIGRQTLEVVTQQPHLRVVALAAGRGWELLAEQARRFRVPLVAIADAALAQPLRRAVPPGTTVLAGPDAMEELTVRCEAEMVLSGVVGACGLRAAMAALLGGRHLAIANKETLVVAGHLVTRTARAAGRMLLPVDSEHSAIHQCLAGADPASVERVIITASGGPFRDWPAERIRAATVEQALNHPTWRMGPKITIDSATMMNKALEVIEAHWLFDLPPERIGVVVHPESIVHSLVEFHDGSVLAQLGWPDMTTPIAYALNYPARLPRPTRRLDLAQAGQLRFQALDPQRFPAIDLAYEVIRRGGSAGAVLNGANEAAVEAFLAGRIPFGRIVPLVAETLNRHEQSAETELEALLRADAWARRCVRARIDES